MAERTEELQKKSPALPSAAQVIAYLRRHPDFLVSPSRAAGHPDAAGAPQRGPGGRPAAFHGRAPAQRRRQAARQPGRDHRQQPRQSRHPGAHPQGGAGAARSRDASRNSSRSSPATWCCCSRSTWCACASSAPRATTAGPKLDGLELLEQGAVDRIMAARARQVLLRDDTVGDPEVFGGAAELVRSDALLRLKPSKAAPNAAARLRHPPSRLFPPGPGHRAPELPRPDHRIRHPLVAGSAAALTETGPKRRRGFRAAPDLQNAIGPMAVLADA